MLKKIKWACLRVLTDIWGVFHLDKGHLLSLNTFIMNLMFSCLTWSGQSTLELRHEKTCLLLMGKHKRRSAAR